MGVLERVEADRVLGASGTQLGEMQLCEQMSPLGLDE